MEQKDAPGRCVATPVLFFTLAGANPQSERVLTELYRTIREKHPSIPQPECMVFSNAEVVQKYFREKQLGPHHAVGLLDVVYCSGKCFFPLQRGEKKRSVAIPDWCPAQWAIAISAKIDDHGI
jgi:hypothetical protein